MITDDQMERAMHYLAETDEQEAELYYEMEKAEYGWKQIKDAMFLSYGSGSVADRQAKANVEDHTEEALERYLQAVQDHRTVKNKRQRAVLTVEVWRSLNANRRQAS